MSNLVVSQVSTLARALDIGAEDAGELIAVLKATAFKGQVSDAQMTALLVVANQYGLNPWTKEIYAFPDRNNGIVPVVGVDGWSRIINSHPQFDGMEFEQTDTECTCIIFRKDRSHATRVTEFMAECRRDGVAPWKSHPRRMLRHKAMIQCARLAFGFVGIYEQDEAERIVEAIDVTPKPAIEPPQPPPAYTDAEFAEKVPAWRDLIGSGQRTAAQVIAMVRSKRTLSEQQMQTIENMEPANFDEPEASANDVAEAA